MASESLLCGTWPDKLVFFMGQCGEATVLSDSTLTWGFLWRYFIDMIEVFKYLALTKRDRPRWSGSPESIMYKPFRAEVRFPEEEDNSACGEWLHADYAWEFWPALLRGLPYGFPTFRLASTAPMITQADLLSSRTSFMFCFSSWFCYAGWILTGPGSVSSCLWIAYCLIQCFKER